jgi:acylphosphatase
MKRVQARILIEGRLQSMNFRLQTQRQAQKLDLVGFVRNLADGRIEIEVQGNEEKIEEMLTWCQQEPHSRHIKSIFYRYEKSNKHYDEFNVH